MPEAGFSRDIELPSGGGKYYRLKAKGDKIKFLIANTPHYETKHWISDRESVLCGKYNGQGKSAPCEWCDKFQAQLEAAGDDEAKIKIAKKIQPKTDFFYPVLDLNTNEAVIFQTTPSVHWEIVGYAEDGVDVFGCVWSVERIEEGSKFYSTRRLDAVKLTEEQVEVLDRAKKIVLNKGRASSSVVPEGDDIVEDAKKIMGTEEPK